VLFRGVVLLAGVLRNFRSAAFCHLLCRRFAGYTFTACGNYPLQKKKYAKNYSPFRKVHRCLALRLYRLRQKKINTQKIMQILHNFVVFGVAPPTACGNYVSKKNKYAKNYPNFDEILGSFAKTTKTLLARKNNTEPCEK